MKNDVESSLFIHNNEVNSIFELLGSKENDLSYSLGYVLTKCPKLLNEIITKVFGNIKFSNVVIKLQQSGDDKGYTDFEIILDNEYFFVIEAKKGWILPSSAQLKRYLPRFRKFDSKKIAFIVLSDCKDNYFKQNCEQTLNNVPIKNLTWSNIISMIDNIYKNSSNTEKLFLHHLKDYLKEVVIMENKESNLVYVVSLGSSIPPWSTISWIDMTRNKNFYFYPSDKNWPKIPPNYIAFRYGGKLQSIHYVEKYEVVKDVHEYMPEIEKGAVENHYLLWLGKKFEPVQKLPTGKIFRSGRRWCMLDTLFTSNTIQEACDISKKRKDDNPHYNR